MSDHGGLVQKTSIRFTKTGDAAYHSHHDLIRFWERAVRRAGLPVRQTQGFNPHPRMVFLHALGVGTASLHEEVEFEFYRRVPEEEILVRLREACGRTLGVVGTTALPPVKKGRTAAAFEYEISGWTDGALAQLPVAIAEVMALEALPMRRGRPGEATTVDIRPYVEDLALSDNSVMLTVVNSLAGTARPDEICRVLAEKCGMDVSFLCILKTGMEIR
ncbi:MAG: TIGR03936 family radical SAM-associated protein [Planctomycetota bacterium]|jgi:radical SAM-linked protein|nr:TIGR03936 family radical SAM-associated protein [Planctomycetota bacterium]